MPATSRIQGMLTPQWPVPSHVRALCTTRAGGVSLPPFDSLNLGDHVGDAPQAVAANRALLAQCLRPAQLAAHSVRPVFLRQVHGVDVAVLDEHAHDGTVADACITHQRGIACTIMVADCLPLLLTDRRGSLVAAAHAGWRGMAGQGGVGIIEQICKEIMRFPQKIRAQAATELIASDILVWLGPCIGPRHFEVGAEVKAAFEASQLGAARHFQRCVSASSDASDAASAMKYTADLQGLARDRLLALGITQIYGNNGSDEWCTASNTAQFFSHRRDAAVLGSTGRMAACVWLAE